MQDDEGETAENRQLCGLTLQFVDPRQEAHFQRHRGRKSSAERDVAWRAGRLASIAIAYALIFRSGGTGRLFQCAAGAHMAIEVFPSLGRRGKPPGRQGSRSPGWAARLCICGAVIALALRMLDPPKDYPVHFAARLGGVAAMGGLAWLPRYRIAFRRQAALSCAAAVMGVGWSSGACCSAWFDGDALGPMVRQASAALDALVARAAMLPQALGDDPEDPQQPPVGDKQACWLLAAFFHVVLCLIAPLAVAYVLELWERVAFLVDRQEDLPGTWRREHRAVLIGQVMLVLWAVAVLTAVAWVGLQVGLDFWSLFQGRVLGDECSGAGG